MSVRPEILNAQINISFENDLFQLPLYPYTTVAQIKQALITRTNLKPHLQILLLGSQILSDGIRLTELGVQNGDELWLHKKYDDSQNSIRVQISNGLSSKSLRCPKSSSVQTLRQEIARLYPGRGSLELEYNGIVLEPEKHLEDYNISEDSQVRVVEQLEGGSE